MKTNKGFFGLFGIFLILAGIFIIGGSTYLILKKNSLPPPPSENIGGDPAKSQNSSNIANNNLTIETKNYTSSISEYSINYPSSWPVVSKSELVNYSDFKIKNSASAVMPGDNSEMRNNDSIISVSVSYGKLSNGINYSNYSTIDDIIKDPKFGLPAPEVQNRLAKVSAMIIDGKNLQVLKMSNSTGESFSFVYAGKAYSMNLMSGSQNQYNNDLKTFTDMISSFKFTTPLVSDCLPTTAPWIKVLSPNGGETYTAGQQIAIKWASCNVKAGFEQIAVHGYPFSSGPIQIDVSNVSVSAGKLDWTIPSNIDTTKKYTIYLETGMWQKNGNEYSVTDESDNPFTINSANISPISTTLPEYIYGQEHWPPVIKDSSDKYSCVTGRVGMGVPVITSEKIINGKTYCVAIADDGAMGKIYKTYTYTASSRGGTKTTTFTLAYQECGAFRDDSSTGGAVYDLCLKNQSSFNLDAIIDSLM